MIRHLRRIAFGAIVLTISSPAVTVAEIAVSYSYKLAMIKMMTAQVKETGEKVRPLVIQLKTKVLASQRTKEAQAEILNRKIELTTQQLGTLSDAQNGVSDTLIVKSKQMVFDNWMESYAISREDIATFESVKQTKNKVK